MSKGRELSSKDLIGIIACAIIALVFIVALIGQTTIDVLLRYNPEYRAYVMGCIILIVSLVSAVAGYVGGRVHYSHNGSKEDRVNTQKVELCSERSEARVVKSSRSVTYNKTPDVTEQIVPERVDLKSESSITTARNDLEGNKGEKPPLVDYSCESIRNGDMFD